jgi:hypothetical protein
MKKFLVLFALPVLFLACKSSSSTESVQTAEVTFQYFGSTDAIGKTGNNYVTSISYSDSAYIKVDNQTYSLKTSFRHNLPNANISLTVKTSIGSIVTAYFFQKDSIRYAGNHPTKAGQTEIIKTKIEKSFTIKESKEQYQLYEPN